MKRDREERIRYLMEELGFTRQEAEEDLSEDEESIAWNNGVAAESQRWRRIAEEMAFQYDECWTPDGEVPDWQLSPAKALRELVRRTERPAAPRAESTEVGNG